MFCLGKTLKNKLYFHQTPTFLTVIKKQHVLIDKHNGKTQNELAKKEKEILKDIRPLTSQMTFEEIAYRMLKIEEQRISESEYAIKKFRIENMSKKYKHKALDSITIEDVNCAMLEVYAVNPSTGKPTAKRTLNRYLDAVSAVFEYGIQCRISSYNPVKYVSVPKGAKVKKRNALTKNERDVILSQTDKRYIPAQIMILTGLRRGELSALTWGDVILKRDT